MTIRYETLTHKERFEEDEDHQAVVSFDGSVGVYTFDIASTEGTAWLLLQDHTGVNDGGPGRPIPDELMGPRMLGETPGVHFGFKNPKSIDVVIEALVKLRRELMIHQGWDMIACTPPGDEDDEDDPAIVDTGNC